MHPSRLVLAALLGLLAPLGVACSDDGPAPRPAGEPATSTSPTAPSSRPSSRPSTVPSGQAPTSQAPQADRLPPVHDPTSLPALMRARYDGGELRRTATRLETDSWTEWEVTYRSGRRTISGVLAVPTGRGPFPAVVLAHGYIDPAVYVTGQGLTRERGALASAGYVVLHTDYRGHAASDDTSVVDRESRLGYTRDVINAVRTLRTLPEVDARRVGLLGRSMGGGVVQDALVVSPGLVGAAVVWSSVSSDFVDNLRQFTVPGRPEVARELEERYGPLRSSNRFFRELSPRTYLDRVTEPVLNVVGTGDDECPPRWNRTTHRLMRAAGVDSTLVEYNDEHAFGPRFTAAMERVVTFLDRRLQG